MSFMFTSCSEYWAYIFTHMGFNTKIPLLLQIVELQNYKRLSKPAKH